MKSALGLTNLSVLILLSSQVHATWKVGAYAELNHTDIRGFQQTPKGGRPDTTSLQRPSFDELGIDSKTYTSFGIWGSYDTYKLSFDYLPLTYKNHVALALPLTTHAISFPAGAPFYAKVDDRLYTLSLSKTFELDSAWEIEPSLTFHFFDHDYSFHSNGSASKRAFWATGLGVGLESRYLLSNHLELSAKVTTTFPATNLDVYHADLSIAYRWNPLNELLLKPYAKVAWDKVVFKDNQPVPNELRYRLYPVWSVGLKAEWG